MTTPFGQTMPNPRLIKAQAIVDQGDVIRIENGVQRLYLVRSQSNPDRTYSVIVDGIVSCDCPDPTPDCKHALSVRLFEEAELEAGWQGFSMNDAYFSAVTEWTAIFSGGVR